MSKFKVGDRVRCVDASRLARGILKQGAEYTVREIRPMRTCEDEVYLEGIVASWVPSRFELIPNAPPEPKDLSHVWQIGKTYKTTLEGVTVKVTEIDDAGDIAGERSDEQFAPWYWVAKTGRMLGRESHKTEPHLLPIEVEPQQVAEQVPSASQKIRDDAAEALAKWDANKAEQVAAEPVVSDDATSSLHRFESGAVRGTDASSTRYDLISPHMLQALAETYAEGAAKYGDDNWLQGIPSKDLMNHAMRHLVLWQLGDTSEPHLAHAIWNLGAIIHFEKTRPELVVRQYAEMKGGE